MRSIKVDVATIADGSATKFSPRISGKVHSVHYLKTDYADGVDFAITAERSGETIWSESNVNAAASRYPRSATHSTAGVAALYAAGGTGVFDKVGLGNDRIKIVIAQGGNVKTGSFVFVID